MKGDLPLTPDDVAEIVAILDGSAYERLDVKTARFRLRVAREGEGWTQEWDFTDEEPLAGGEQAAATAPAEVEIPEGMTAIRATLPGTFYRAPQPGEPPFVEVGAKVDADTTVGIVETMKLFNPVAAGCSGEVAEILVDNAAMVEAGAVLMLVR